MCVCLFAWLSVCVCFIEWVCVWAFAWLSVCVAVFVSLFVSVFLFIFGGCVCFFSNCLSSIDLSVWVCICLLPSSIGVSISLFVCFCVCVSMLFVHEFVDASRSTSCLFFGTWSFLQMSCANLWYWSLFLLIGFCKVRECCLFYVCAGLYFFEGPSRKVVFGGFLTQDSLLDKFCTKWTQINIFFAITRQILGLGIKIPSSLWRI